MEASFRQPSLMLWARLFAQLMVENFMKMIEK